MREAVSSYKEGKNKRRRTDRRDLVLDLLLAELFIPLVSALEFR